MERTPDPDSVAAQGARLRPVDGDQLWARLMELAAIGGRADGGVNRQALSEEDIAARRLLTRWGRSIGLEPQRDPIGNLFLRLQRTGTRLAPVLAGSHLDSQPNGGKFDGAYGVVAALEATAAIVASGVRRLRPIDIVVWCNEEGSRFAPGAMGSSAFSGAASLEHLLSSSDDAGITVHDALARAVAALPEISARPLGCDVAAYVEAHIEQGPILESEGATIGVVTGIQGVRWFTIEVRGREGHAGTTPMQNRRDALQTAIDIIAAFRTRAIATGDAIRMTVGRMTVDPNSPNTIPGRVSFTIDLRHPEDALIERLTRELAAVCAQHAGPCSVEIRTTLDMTATLFSPDVIGVIEGASAERGLRSKRLVSGAFHDAKFLAQICPTGMIFVPCAGGLSHHPEESATPADLLAGANVLAATILELANWQTG